MYTKLGLTVKPIKISNVTAGVTGGSLNLGIEDTEVVVDSINKGVDYTIVGGWRDHKALIIAVAPGINSAQDLEGKDVALGALPGDPQLTYQEAALKEVGWDLSKVHVNFVNPPGFSNSRVPLLESGKVALTFLFTRQAQTVLDAGCKILVNRVDTWESDVIFGTKSWVAAHPNEVARFIEGTIESTRYFMDASHQAKIVPIIEKDAKTQITPDILANWDAEYNTHNPNLNIPADSWTAVLQNTGVKDPGLANVTDLGPLHAAQQALGIPTD